jgi:hypothetical protein
MKNPIQPVEKDAHGVLRFKANALVLFLLENGGIDMNRLASVEASVDDRQQFAQLIGYSVSGYGSLSYANNYVYGVAHAMADGKNESAARIEVLEGQLSTLRQALREPMAELFEVDPSDLKGD